MKKTALFATISGATLATLVSCGAPDILAMEKKGSYDFCINETVYEDGHVAYGLNRDRDGISYASIASTGFCLAALPIGVENDWLEYDTAKGMALQAIESISELDRIEGFYYHFYDVTTGKPTTGVELSVIDTGIYVMGAMFIAEYFGGEVKDAFNTMYDEINWPFYYNENKNQFYMAYRPTTGYSGAWDVYAEQLMLYFLAAGSDTHPIGKEAYDSWTRLKASYGDYEFIHSWFGSLFTHQFSHAFIDFSKIVDDEGIDWFENSRQATLANRQYAIDNKDLFESFGKYGWGMTAGDGPNGYSGFYGAEPNGYNGANDQEKNDGTITMAGAIGSLPFAPKEVIETMEYWYDEYGDKVFGKYGFYDGYNLDEDWFDDGYIGIDKGISLLMIENYQTGLIWKNIMKNENILKAVDELDFRWV